MSAGARFRAALEAERPLQIVGTVNAYTAMLAEKAGFRAIYLSGAGVDNASFGLPDLAMTTLSDVCEDVRRIAGATPLPLLVDADTGFGSAFMIGRTIRELARAGAAWEALAEPAGSVPEGAESAEDVDKRPDWVELPFEGARISAPDVHAAATSVQVRTGLWRSVRPVIDQERCHRCTWLCSTLCPDSAIAVDPEGAPRIDLDHCKGCMICVAICPTHAIESIPEAAAAKEEKA